MTNPSTLATALVTKLRAIAELVTEFGGDANSIFAYEDEFPTSNSILDAVVNMQRPGLMVAWNGTGLGRRNNLAHRFSLYVKAPGKYTTVANLIFNGVPAGGDGLIFRRTPIHSSCTPIFGDITAERRSLPLSLDPPVTLEYFEFPLVLTECGANQ
jgi:hypothetical protein